MIKNDLKGYKESRKQFERALDRYEAQLNRYHVLSKQKEASALREDAFQMHELRKAYVRSSGEYFSILVAFKESLEQMLVSCFTGALDAYIDDIDESAAACAHARTKINGWKYWLDEKKRTSDYQLEKMNKRYTELQDAYINQSKPHRSLKRYSTSSNDPMSAVSPMESDDDLSTPDTNKNEKQGYLNCRIATPKVTRPPWNRKWFFLQDGWFGTCTVSTVQKEKGCIVLGDRIRISEAIFRICSDVDRRFCFEVTHPKYTFYLQAETEQEMQQWLWAIENSRDNPASTSTPSLGALLSPKTNMKSTNIDGLIAMSTSPLPSPKLEPNSSTTTSSLTCLMIRESYQSALTSEATSQTNTNSNISNHLSSWGMPWLSTGINAFAGLDDDQSLQDNKSIALHEPNQVVIWPTKLEMDVSKPSLMPYPTYLEESQRELRRYFSHVPEQETVLESFVASFYPFLEDSFGYSGKAYLTQTNLWFYSCTFMTCVNMVVIPFEKIKSVRLEDTMMLIDTEPKQFCFSLWLTLPSMISEKLKCAVENYKTMDIKQLYDTLRNINPPPKTKKIPTNHVTTSSALYASITPITVQAQQQYLSLKPNASTSTTTTTDEGEDNHSTSHHHEEDNTGTSFAHNSPAQGALAAVAAKSNQQKRKSIMKPTSSTKTTTTTPSNHDWPSDIPQPKEPVSCGCKDHLEKIEADLALSCNAKQLFDLLFSDQSTVWTKLNQSKDCSDPEFSSWQNQERTMQYIMPVSNPMIKAKETQVIETQHILQEKPHLCYTVVVKTKTPHLPYADAFLPTIKYCITFVSPTESRLVCSIGVQWLKNIFVKGMVNRAAIKGMQETIAGILPLVKAEVSKETKQQQKEEDKPKPKPTDIPNKRPYVSLENKMPSLWTWILGLMCILSAIYQLYVQHRYQALLQDQQTVTWYGIYLRDVEEQLAQKQMVHVNSTVYNLFREAKVRYQWTSKQHRTMAAEIDIMKERLGVLRYELLSNFRILNLIECQLLENEYYNWVSDKMLHCQEDGLCQLLEDELA
ncbi:uncharacterized protein B0P05DRAFT_561784 [Gilbertella persicaria]|uniref:uncharacterized protein n=1 Tax=Gilbertella persicaria TaxID=101096 RepID=UPI00221F1781|nr:uncharacterized protein B0P05DRAFT_561784 [Gilbertella persicaria]KAI8053147.1 hypothetical protein B0P05DRAFT_561784 [Gilbertella persicaria]